MALGNIVKSVKKSLGFSLSSDEAIEAFCGNQTASNIQVNATLAMSVAAVNCAVSTISDKAGDLPAKIFSRASKETVRDHPAYKLIHDEANPHTSAGGLRISLTMDALLNDKGGFAQVVRSDDGRPLELQRLDPNKVTCAVEADGDPFYLVQEANRKVRYEFYDILHVRDPRGKCAVTLGREVT